MIRSQYSPRSVTGSPFGSKSPGSTSSKRYFPKEPLGVTPFHDHEIKPVPPTFVSEYEEKFVWPTRVNNVGAEKSSQTEFVSHWDELLKVVDQLIANGYEPHVLYSIREEITKRKLDPSIEFLYQHAKDVLDRNRLLPAGNTAFEGRTSIETMRACKDFVDTVKKIKEA